MDKKILEYFKKKNKDSSQETPTTKHKNLYHIPYSLRPKFKTGDTPFQKLKAALPDFWYQYTSYEDRSIKNEDIRLKKFVSMLKSYGKMLDKMDEHFQKHGFYDVVDYDAVVKSIIDNKRDLTLVIDETLNDSTSGNLKRYSGGDRDITLNEKYLKHRNSVEDILCHEFIHFITLGIKNLYFSENNKTLEINEADNTIKLKYFASVLDEQGNKVDKPKFSNILLNNSFFTEGLTECLTQQIYPESDSYAPHVNIVKLLNAITGRDINFNNFLSLNLNNYTEAIGEENFRKVNEYCENFHKKWVQSNYTVKYETDPDYNRAHDIICTSILNRIKEYPDKYSIDHIISIISTIQAEAPIKDENIKYGSKYKLEIKAAIQAVAANKTSNPEDRKKFSEILRDTIEDNSNNINRTFYLPNSDFVISAYDENDFVVSYKDRITTFLGKNPKEHLRFDTADYSNSTDHAINVLVEPQKSKYSITARSLQDGQQESLTIIPRGTDSNKLLVGTSENVYEIDLAKEQAKREKKVKSNIALLNNMEAMHQIDKVIESNPNLSIRHFKEITTDNGATYLIASTNAGIIAYKDTENGYQPIPLQSQSNIHAKTKIKQKLQLNDTIKPFYKSTPHVTDTDSIIYTLEDNVALFTYFDKNNNEKIGQVLNDGDSLIVGDETTLYYNEENNKEYFENNAAWQRREAKRPTQILRGVTSKFKNFKDAFDKFLEATKTIAKDAISETIWRAKDLEDNNSRYQSAKIYQKALLEAKRNKILTRYEIDANPTNEQTKEL